MSNMLVKGRLFTRKSSGGYHIAGMAEKEIELLETVELRFALADTNERFEKSLGHFLVPVLAKLDSPHEAVRAKVMGICSHVSKRLKADLALKLPLAALLDLFGVETTSQLVRNFILIYLEMGFHRIGLEEQIKLLPGLLRGLADRLPAQQTILFQIALPVLADLNPDRLSLPHGINDDPFHWRERPADLKFLLDKFLDLALYTIPAAGNKPGESNNEPFIPPSLSKEAILFLTNNGKALWVRNATELRHLKLGIARLLSKSSLIQEQDFVLEKFKVYVALASDSNHEIVDAGEDGLRRQSKPNMEDEQVVQALYFLYQGTGQISNLSRIRSPGSVTLKNKVLGFLLQSARATNKFPHALQVSFDAIYGDTTTPRLRASGMSFVQWIARMASAETIKSVAPVLLSGVLRFISEQEPAPGNESESGLRGFAYEAVGLLSKRAPECFDTSILFDFFKALSTEPRNVRISIQDALSNMAHAYKGLAAGQERQELERLLLENIDKSEPQARYVALKYATVVFPPSYPLRQYLCLIGASDQKPDVRDVATRGLSLPNPPVQGQDLAEWQLQLPKFDEMMSLLLQKSRETRLKAVKPPGSQWVGSFTADTYTDALKYLRKLLIIHADPSASYDDGDDLTSLAGTTRTALKNVLQTAYNNEDRRRPLQMFLEFIEFALKSESSDALLQSVAASCLFELVSLCPSELSTSYSDRIDWLKSFLTSSRSETRASMANILAIVATSGLENKDRSERIVNLIQEILSVSDSSAQTSFENRNGATLALGSIAGRLLYRYKEPAAYVPPAILSLMVQRIGQFLEADSSLEVIGAAQALAECGRYAPLPVDSKTSTDFIDRMVSIAKKTKEAKVQEQIIASLGHLAIGDPALGARILEYFFTLSATITKQVEIHFTIGEAVTAAACGFTATHMERYLDIADVSELSVPTPPTTLATQILDRILDDIKPGSRPIVRKNVAIWLLCFVKYGGQHSIVTSNVVRIQNAFTSLLSDRDDFTQEIASKGMGLVFELGDGSVRSELVTSLVGTLTEGRKITPQSVSGETQIFSENALGSAPDGEKLSGTYQSILSLASDLNQPDLVYRFMSLASHNAIWTSRRGASLGFSAIAAQATAELQPHLPQMVPKLYRFQFDPNPKVAESMQNIWKSLIKEPKKVLDEYFALIMQDLLKNLGERQWRTREASCLALADLIQGKTMEQLRPYLEDMWTMCFRVLDDIKESVRIAAFKTCKTLTNITVRYCDPSVVSLSEGSKITAIIVPFFLSKGLGSMAEDVRNHSLATLLKICSKGGALLKPHLADLIGTLLESLSSLEPQVLNYLTFHTDKYSISAEQLESSRLSATKMSPIMDAISRLVDQIDEATLPAIVPRLNTLIRKGVGLPTKAGCARFVYSLVQRVPSELKPYADGILQSLKSAVHDRSPVIRKAFAGAIGYIARLASDKALVKLLEDLEKAYFDSEDEEIASIAGITLLEISRRAPERLKDFQQYVLPVAYLGARDPRESIKVVWVSVWEEMTGGSSGAVRVWMLEMLSKMKILMATTSSWGVKKQVAQAISDMSKVLGTAFGTQTGVAIQMLIDALAGRTWEGKEVVISALATTTVECREWILNPENAGMAETIVNVMIREAKKNNKAYKRHSMEAMGTALNSLQIDRFEEVQEHLVDLCTDEQDEMDVDEPHAKPLGLAIKAVAFKALGLSWPRNAQTQVKYAKTLGTLLARNLDGNVWNVRLAVLEAMDLYFEKLDVEASSSVLDSEIISDFLRSLFTSLEDTKYTAVREASAKVLKKLVQRLRSRFDEHLLNQLLAGLSTAISRETQPIIAHILKEVQASAKG
ncbi:uncharacterized protein SPPG_05780 [Spizellomyces punctatus DAOM BR117]|uniref:TOG domain-containing protein n=1 Tax=Spizellomyces punctatus (strain DAOM BR117) TaxID=645134 RepID=A0A0L0HC90_SPIPD|nr:uncharacterized protein SPPG_05780 [Spizellomyces punctatus DAOM BR117]KNC98802.1 hypothetical protein SPPG_05780 [Spizellomyces punctatus DAOM BR117]|eukprot:XP_016606842.1 hypothetical protein SPPG_05780 [Spizellomyces punctatus DAOM BR117]